MSVKFILPSYLAQYADNQETVEVDGTTIRECLSDLIRKYPEMKPEVFDLSDAMEVIVIHEGNYISDKMIDNPVKQGDKIDLYPILVGG